MDDPFLGKKLARERDGIFLWALEGLYRLIQNDYRFTVSADAQENLEQLIYNSNNVLCFLNAPGYVRQDPRGSVTSRELYESYRSWCGANFTEPLSGAAFFRQLSDQCRELGLTQSNHLPGPNGRSARGFRGLRLCG